MKIYFHENGSAIPTDAYMRGGEKRTHTSPGSPMHAEIDFGEIERRIGRTLSEKEKDDLEDQVFDTYFERLEAYKEEI